MLNFTKRTAAAKRERVSLYAELFRNLFTDGTHKHEMLKLVQHDKSNVIASEPGRAWQSRSGFCGLLRRFTPRNDNRVFAFTLAEVLITLVIIGVIAALTIPNLLQKYQEEALKTAYKKTYNVLNNAYKMVIAENGPLECNYYRKDNKTYSSTTDCQTFYSKFFNILKVAKHCKNNALQNGCLPEGGYKNAESVEKENGMSDEYISNRYAGCPALTGMTFTNGDSNLEAVILADGQIIIYKSYWLHMFVDTNGKKGPNKWGYDIFEFDIGSLKIKSEPVISYGWTSCVLVEKGGKTPQEMYNSAILNK